MSNNKKDKKVTATIEGTEGLISVTATVIRSGVKVFGDRSDKRLEVRPFVTETATVSVKKGLTIPLADYASARVDVFVSMPCYVEEVLDVYKDVNDLVERLVAKESKKVRENLG